MAVNGIGVAAAVSGVILLYAGVKGVGVGSAIRSVIAGEPPSAAQPASTITDPITSTAGTVTVGGTTESSATVSPSKTSNIQNLGIAKMLAAAMGWTGSEWSALTGVVNRESGGSATAKNPSSGALGFGQALGHGNASTAGTLGNEYGGEGLTDAQAQAANSGNVHWQIIWTLNYIKDRYGTPSAALAHENAYGWY